MATITWLNVQGVRNPGGDYFWENARNWDTGTIPGSTDSAILPSGTDFGVVIGNRVDDYQATVRSLTLGTSDVGSVNLDILNGSSLTISQAFSVCQVKWKTATLSAAVKRMISSP